MKQPQEGFTVVELLITLFVAVAFLVSGWQLYSLVIRESGEARSKSRAINIAYDYIQRYSAQATTPCTIQNPLTDSPLAVSGLGEALITVNISCPKPNASAISKVQVTIKYGSPQQTTIQSTLINKIDQTPLENGLVGWWPMNGNATDNSGKANNGTVYGATPTTGQNGAANNAYSFDGVGNYINCGNLGNLPNQGTISFWMKADVVENYRNAFTTDYNGSNNAIRFEEYTTPSPLGGFTAAIGNATSSGGISYLPSSVLSPNTWYHVALVWNKSINNVVGYLNKEQKFSTSNTYWPTTMPAVTIGNGFNTTRYWKGSIDDVRIYNRALSSADVQSLYALGAF